MVTAIIQLSLLFILGFTLRELYVYVRASFVLKCIYSYFLKTHDFLQSILGILAADKHFLKD